MMLPCHCAGLIPSCPLRPAWPAAAPELPWGASFDQLPAGLRAAGAGGNAHHMHLDVSLRRASARDCMLDRAGCPTRTSDVWSLGHVVHEVASSACFQATGSEQALRREPRLVAKSCLKLRPWRRPVMADVAARLCVAIMAAATAVSHSRPSTHTIRA